MTQLTTLPAPPRPRRRRWRIALVLVAVLTVGLVGAWWYLVWSEERDFQAAVAETELLDPHWRYADIEAARTEIPDEQNAAVQVVKVRRMGTGGIALAMEEQIGALPMNVQLNAAQTAALRTMFNNETKRRAEAHRLKDFATGRYPSVYDVKTATISFDWPQQPRELAHYLMLSAQLAAQDHDAVQLADACRAAINNARSMGDEPTMIGLLVRVAILEISLPPLERGLAQVELPPAELQALQDLLQREIDEPRLWWTLRGERAISMDMIESMSNGRLPSTAVTGGLKGRHSWLPKWLPVPVAHERATHLRGMTAVVEASKQPVEKHHDAIDQAIQKWQGRAVLLDGVLSGCIKTTGAHLRNQAKLRCAVVALAAERFRQEKGAWPGSLEVLVQAGQLKAVPLDPFDGRPLRSKRLADGVLFYSVGADRTDNDGNIDRTNPIAPGVDIGFRLYDPEARRRPMGQ